MSFIRLLSSARLPIAGPSSASQNSDPTLKLHVPAFGAVFQSAPAMRHGIEHREDVDRDAVIQGDLEVYIPPHMGRRRCKALRVLLRTTAKLDMGTGRKGEEDVLFERRVEFLPDTSEGFWLEEEQQWFAFTIIVPSTLAAHDWHPNGTIRHTLIAEMEGLNTNRVSSSISSFRSISPGRKSSRPRKSPISSRSVSPEPQATFHHNLSGNISAVLPEVPSYESLSGEWIQGYYATQRNIMLFYNPHPGGGITELDERGNGYAENLGVWDMRISSNPWSIGGVLDTHFNLDSIASTATVFTVKVSLSQTTTITSPRDPEGLNPVTTISDFLVAETGRQPLLAEFQSSKNLPALWKGEDAGGTDTESLKVHLTGRIPDDQRARPSTLPGVVTPIRVAQRILIEVFFSLRNDQKAGVLQKLKIKRPVVIPSCLFVPQVVELPSYDTYETNKFESIKVNQPCPCCRVRPSDNFCRKCPGGLVPHLRHDHDPKQVGRPDGRCPVCRRDWFPAGDPGWHYCACGMGVEQMTERLRKGEIIDDEGDDRDFSYDKEIAERGRPR